jgi:hypothetical protein
VDTNGDGIGSSFLVSQGLGTQSRPRVAFDGNQFLGVWNRLPDDVTGARVTQTGAVLDPSAIVISSGQARNPAVAFGDGQFLVVWQATSDEDIVGARVSSGGAVLDPSGFKVSDNSNGEDVEPAVGHDGSTFVVTWARSAAFNAYDIYSNRVTGAATVLDGAGAPVSVTAGPQRRPYIACSGGACFTAWDVDEIFGRVLTNGAPMVPPGPVHVSKAGNEQSHTSVVDRQGPYFVVWQDRRTGPDWNVYGVRLDASGAVLDPLGIAISQANGDQFAPRVAASASGYLVTWEDHRHKATPDSPYTDVYAARVSARRCGARPRWHRDHLGPA